MKRPGRMVNLHQPRSWYKIVRNDAGGPTRVDVYDEIGGGGWLFGGVSAADFVAELKEITGDIEVHINSPGGDVFDGIAIYNAIAGRSGNVTTVVDGIAASIASVIAQAGKTRIIAPGAMMMIHDGLAMCVGNAADMRDTADLLDQVSGNIASIYAAHSGQEDGWREAMQAETWYTAEQAVEAGLADQLAERPAAPDAAARFDLSIFAKVPDWVAARTAPPAGDDAVIDQWLTHISNADVDESSWDGDAAMKAAGNSEDPAAAFKGICAGRKEGPPDERGSWALPHHKHKGDPPNRAGVNNAMSRLPQTQGLTNEAAARAHLENHQSAMGSKSDDRADLPAWLQDA